ncbi:PopZ family protein [Stappia sp.]|uniref:PopZ family protein n=1 Tax=Stappia sp. TaxID=1870903 RepID=UPI003A9A16D0
MEEILASIRRIISDEDTPSDGKAEAASGVEAVDDALADAGEEMSQDDLDKLFDSAGDDDVEVEPDPEPEPEPEAVIDDVLELTEDQAVDTDDFDLVEGLATAEEDIGDVAFVDETAEADAPKSTEWARAPRESTTEELLSPSADQAVQAAFHNLAGTILSNNARTLEDLVKEMLRPMLKGWLDENLPPLVERLVRQEIERVSRGR